MRLMHLLAAGLILLPAAAPASTTQPGYVSTLNPLSNGTVVFNSSGARSAAPACQGANLPQRWAIDATTPTGQAKIAVLLTAYALHRQIQIVGLNACPNWGDTETVDYFVTVGDN